MRWMTCVTCAGLISRMHSNCRGLPARQKIPDPGGGKSGLSGCRVRLARQVEPIFAPGGNWTAGSSVIATIPTWTATARSRRSVRRMSGWTAAWVLPETPSAWLNSTALVPRRRWPGSNLGRRALPRGSRRRSASVWRVGSAESVTPRLVASRSGRASAPSPASSPASGAAVGRALDADWAGWRARGGCNRTGCRVGPIGSATLGTSGQARAASAPVAIEGAHD